MGCISEHAWVCEVYTAWTAGDVRVPEPVRPAGADDAWSVDGWAAHVLVPGRDADPVTEIDRILDASDAFHTAVADLPRPTFLDERRDPWAFGDRLAWEEGVEPEGDEPTLRVIGWLRDHLAPVTSPGQVIHGDVLPNVLLHDRLPPAMIDWPPYYRPAAMATAIAVTDAVTFKEAPLALLETCRQGADWDQLLIRALLYRLGPTGVFAARNRLQGGLKTHVERVQRIVDTLIGAGRDSRRSTSQADSERRPSPGRDPAQSRP